MDGEIRMWSDLPQELVEKIANCLDAETDVRRFRTICSSWRSLTRPFKRSLCPPLKLPFFSKTCNPLYKDAYYSLKNWPESTEPRFWLVMTERTSDGKLRILNPICGRRMKILPKIQLPKLLNTLNFCISEGQIYVVDEFRGTMVFDSIFQSTEIARRPVHHHAAQSNLVELYKGELFLVESYTTGVPLGNGCMRIKIFRFDKQSEKWVGTNTIDNHIIFLGHNCSFSVSAKEFDGCKGTRVFYESEFIYFLTDDAGYMKRDLDEINFGVSDEVKLKFRGLHGHSTGVCDFATGKLGSLLMHPEYAAIFWPPPSWLTRNS
ncbi:UNVERIFIED_CONTAM: F-box protein SKIP23 [Sesamum latifolium]|uniref:F-box protein SKIP23 n=1 Tax=Sesamum latifolium TaxID=2727402 RepID=A0AAW2U347_9LAMI